MTKFDKALFKFDGLFLMYDSVFIARFKRGGMASFKSFLIKNFTVEEYFKSQQSMTPMAALAAKGYVTPQVKKVLIAAGFPATSEGSKQYIASLGTSYAFR